ncbi:MULTISPECIES: hypothetical protein [Burkholderia]|uniref:hypothetical protein n=1 Tax=Burkholderia TaxID=32008 RepID=UPI003AF80741
MTAQSDDDQDELIDYSTLSETEIYERLIHRWLSFFLQNADFEAYCEAKRVGDAGATACNALEAKHARIAELYEDWGDIHALPELPESSDAWNQWVSSKRHLFGVGKFDELTADTADNAVPCDEVAHNPSQTGDDPKYRIATIKSQTKLKLLNRLDRALIVNDLLGGSVEYTSPDGPLDFEYSHREIAALALKVPSIGRDFGWFPRGDQLQRLNAGTLPLSDLESYKNTILEADAFYWACVDGTIRGIFPSKIPSKKSDRQSTKRSR